MGGGSGNVPKGTDVLLMNAYKGSYLLERNGNPGFTTKDERIKNNAAVWNVEKVSDFLEAQKPKEKIKVGGPPNKMGGSGGSGCPAGTLAYHKGSHCCKEKVDKNGKDITYDSDHCKGNNNIVCPLGKADGSCKDPSEADDDEEDDDDESGKKGKGKGKKGKGKGKGKGGGDD